MNEYVIYGQTGNEKGDQSHRVHGLYLAETSGIFISTDTPLWIPNSRIKKVCDRTTYCKR